MTYPPRRRPGGSTRDKWETRVAKAKGMPPSTRLFLTAVLAKHMKANGEVSRPRPQLALEMGCDERTVSRHITRAHEAGWLRTVSPGCLGHTAVYAATWGEEMRDTNVSQPASRCGTPSTPHLGDRNVPHLGEMRDTNVPPVVSNYMGDAQRDSGDVADGHDRDAGHGSKSTRLAEVRQFRRDTA